MTYTLIAHTELASAQANIEFTSIPATFTDLLLVVSVRSVGIGAGNGMLMALNTSTANFSWRMLYGQGSGSGVSINNTSSFSGVFYTGSGDTSNTFASGQVYFPNYRSSVAKSYSADGVTENNATGAFQGILAGLWNNTAAISSIRLFTADAANWAQFSSATLYGITAGSSGGVVVS